MKVRPIFWYMLTVVLTAAFLLGTHSHWQAAEALRQAGASNAEQEYHVSAEKTNTALFLEALAAEAEGSETELTLFTTSIASEQAAYSCQISATGAYNDLARLLSWLETQPCVAKIAQFALEEGEDGTMQLVVELILG